MSSHPAACLAAASSLGCKYAFLQRHVQNSKSNPGQHILKGYLSASSRKTLRPLRRPRQYPTLETQSCAAPSLTLMTQQGLSVESIPNSSLITRSHWLPWKELRTSGSGRLETYRRGMNIFSFCQPKIITQDCAHPDLEAIWLAEQTTWHDDCWSWGC